jgi:hypothetical protein
MVITPAAGSVMTGQFRNAPLHPQLADIGFIELFSGCTRRPPLPHRQDKGWDQAGRCSQPATGLRPRDRVRPQCAAQSRMAAPLHHSGQEVRHQPRITTNDYWPQRQVCGRDPLRRPSGTVRTHLQAACVSSRLTPIVSAKRHRLPPPVCSSSAVTGLNLRPLLR